MFDWNDLKAFLAVARQGSSLAGAKALGVNQTTAARRIEALEQALGLKLFERGQSGSRLTEAGRDLFSEAEKVERATASLQSRAEAHQRGLAGTLKVTCTEIIANTAITPAIGAFRKLYPEVQIDVMITDRPLDIEAGEADIAIRSGRALPQSDLIARKLADYEFALYCSRDYVGRKGFPSGLEDLRDHDLIAGDATLGPLPGMARMFELAGGKPPAHSSNSMTNLFHAVKAGLGIAPLSCILSDADPALVRCSDPMPEEQVSSWLVTRRELKDTPRARAFIDFLAPYIAEEVKRRRQRNLVVRAQVIEEMAALEVAIPGVALPAGEPA